MFRAVFLLVMLVVLGPAHPMSAETITSDTVDYCDSLADKIQAVQDVPADAHALLIQGRAMCERGHVVGGLRRLRLALMIMHGRGSSP